MSENMVPSELIDLPSRGWYYQKTSPLASGQIDMYYMTARHEDLLTSRTLIEKGVVIERLLRELVVDKNINFDDLLLGDKNAMMIAARIMGYGKDYPIEITCSQCGHMNSIVLNLETVEPVKIDFVEETKGKNDFTFMLPISKKVVRFKLPTQGSDIKIRDELRALQKVAKSDVSHEVTTRMKHAIISIDGNADPGFIKQAVDSMLVRDSKAFREYVQHVAPDIDLSTDFTCTSCNYSGRVEVPITPSFFWPDARV